MSKQKRLLTLAVSLLVLTTAPAFAGPELQYQNPRALYDAGKYNQALQGFEAVARAKPTDATAHYYIGLCCQNLLQKSRAAKEYQYVAATSSNAQLRQMAQTALARLASSSQTVTTGFSARDRAAAASRWAAVASLSAGPNGGTSAARGSRVKKVIEFYTNWCHVCSDFAPTFEQTKNKYGGRVEFLQLDAEDGANAEMTARYAVKRYPTMIYLDTNGVVLRRSEGAPMGASFANTIESL